MPAPSTATSEAGAAAGPGYSPPDIPDPANVSIGSPVSFAGPLTKVLFGPSARHALPGLVAELKGTRPAVICTPGRRRDGEQIAALLSGEPLLLAEAVMHTPVAVSEAAAATAKRAAIDILVSVGGGSSVGLGKALTKRLGLKHIALPTTYAGSEITPILGESQDGHKRTIRDDALRPAAVIYDPQLIATLPSRTAAASGMNAIAHAVEALTVSTDPEIVRAARRSIELFADALPRIVADPRDAAARASALYAAWLAAYCLAEVPMALHHKLCHALGGAYDMPHAETHAAVLPHSIGYNLPACPNAEATVRDILGANPAGQLFDLVRALGLPLALSEIGLPKDGIDIVARLACANPYSNPRPFDEAAIASLLREAWQGSRPGEEPSHA